MKFITLLVALLLASITSAATFDQNTLEQVMVLANRGNAEAQYHVGMMHNNGVGGASKDPKLAFDWFLKSAAGKDPLGAYKLGCYYAGQFPDAAPLDPSRLAMLDDAAWDRARFAFHPTLVVRPVRAHLGSLWAGIESGDTFIPLAVEAGLSVRVWRKGLQPHFRMIAVEEDRALEQLMQGLTFAELCARLPAADGVEPVERAGAMLAVWLQDELIVSLED